MSMASECLGWATSPETQKVVVAAAGYAAKNSKECAEHVKTALKVVDSYATTKETREGQQQSGEDVNYNKLTGSILIGGAIAATVVDAPAVFGAAMVTAAAVEGRSLYKEGCNHQ